MKEKYIRAASWILTAGFIAVFLFCCTSPALWFDEQYSVCMARHPYGRIIQNTALDVHPPLYCFILRAAGQLASWLPLPQQLVAAKVVSVFPMALAMVLGCTWVARLFDRRAGLFFVVCMGCTPQMAAYGTEVRMYSWGLLFMVVCALSAFEWLRTGRHSMVAAMALSAAACLYTQYWAGMAAGIFLGLLVVYGWVIRRQTDKGVLVAGVAALLLFAPWAPVALRQTVGTRSTGGQHTPLSLYLVRGYFEFVFSSGWGVVTLLFLGTLMAAGCSFLFNRKKSAQSWHAFLCVAALGGLLLVGMAAQAFLQPTRVIFQGRYIFPCLGVFWLGISVWLAGLQPRALRGAALSVLFMVGIVQGARALETLGQDWKEYSEWKAVSQQLEDGGGFLAVDHIAAAAVRCYLPQAHCAVLGQQEAQDTFSRVFEVSPQADTAHWKGNIWLALQGEDISDEAVENLARQGYTAGKIHSVSWGGSPYLFVLMEESGG